MLVTSDKIAIEDIALLERAIRNAIKKAEQSYYPLYTLAGYKIRDQLLRLEEDGWLEVPYGFHAQYVASDKLLKCAEFRLLVEEEVRLAEERIIYDFLYEDAQDDRVRFYLADLGKLRERAGLTPLDFERAVEKTRIKFEADQLRRRSMRICAIGDIHGEIERLSLVLDAIQKLKPDFVFLVGDIGPNYYPPGNKPPTVVNEARWVSQTEAVLDLVADKIGTTNYGAPKVVAVWGNHDAKNKIWDPSRNGKIAWVEDSPLLNPFVTGFGGAQDHFGFPNEWNEDRLRACDYPDFNGSSIALTHAPPFGILDKTKDGDVVGSVLILEQLAKSQVSLHVFGHVHEAVGIQKIGKRTFVNCGSLGAPYGKAQFAVCESEDLENWNCWIETVSEFDSKYA
jgi:Icc-related predicted phosphoesterase